MIRQGICEGMDVPLLQLGQTPQTFAEESPPRCAMRGRWHVSEMMGGVGEGRLTRQRA